METFVNYRRYRWLWLNLALVVVLIILYLLDEPVGGRNGGTILGYTYGAIATAGILYLMWFGVRKRSYSGGGGTLKGWLSAHIWLGLALTIIVPLHAGFSFGLNVHTGAYVAMVATVLSGIWGAFNYASLAAQVQSHRGGGSMKKLLEQLYLVSRDLSQRGQDRSDHFQRLLQRADFDFQPSVWRALFGTPPAQIDREQGGRLVADLPSGEQEEGLKVLDLANRKRQLAGRILNEAVVMAKLRLWLYLHLPISIGLLVLLAIHIFTVFWYW